jgi:putative DNA primase/helicase
MSRFSTEASSDPIACDDAWQKVVTHWQETGEWDNANGPKPGESGCRVPAYLLDCGRVADVHSIAPDFPPGAATVEIIAPRSSRAGSDSRPPANGACPHSDNQGLPASPSHLPLTLSEFLALDIKPREMVLDPIIQEKGLAMLCASRGTGKTHVALGIAYAVATGTPFLRWSAPKPRRVLYIDGEMPASALQERLASIVAGAEVEPSPATLKILAGDLIEEGGIGNLAAPETQAKIDPLLQDIDLLILDNLSCLTAVIRDNDAESWGPMQNWLLQLRRRGVSVLIVHHAGKGGQQRGTSRREDVLDTSISLRRSSDYTPADGARFEVHLEKARGVHGDAAKPFEAHLVTRDGAAVWSTRDIEDVNHARVKALLDEELSVRVIAEETGIPKSTVHRLKKRIKQEVEGDDDSQ